MSKTSLKPINYSSGVPTVTPCPTRMVKKIYENPESIKNWVNARDKELNDKIEKIYNKIHQEIADISSGLEGLEIKDFRGTDAIDVVSLSEYNEIRLKIHNDDKVLTQDSEGIRVVLDSFFDPATKNLKILGKEGQTVTECQIDISGGSGEGSIDTSDFYTKEEIDNKGFLTQSDVKTVNGESIVGQGNISLNTLTNEQMSQIQALLALGIRLDTKRNILSIGGKRYQLTESTQDLTGKYYIGVTNTLNKTAFSLMTTTEILSVAEEKDISMLDTGVDVYNVTKNLIFLMIPDNIVIDKITMGEPPLMTTWANSEWTDSTIWKQTHEDIVIDGITYHLYGYRAVDMEQSTPTKFQIYLHKS